MPSLHELESKRGRRMTAGRKSDRGTAKLCYICLRLQIIPIHRSPLVFFFITFASSHGFSLGISTKNWRRPLVKQRGGAQIPIQNN
jgi:hypothetical protein